jgi:hypothetical protein
MAIFRRSRTHPFDRNDAPRPSLFFVRFDRVWTIGDVPDAALATQPIDPQAEGRR